MKQIEKRENYGDPVWEHLKQLSIEISAHWPPDISVADAINDIRSEGQVEEMQRWLASMEQLAHELAPLWPKDMDAVDIVRDVRRDL
jgi:hypothetical protein